MYRAKLFANLREQIAGDPKNFWGALGLRPLGWRRWLIPYNTPLPASVSMPNLIATCQMVRTENLRGKIGRLASRLTWSLEVIENNTIHAPVSYHFRDKRRFRSKNANFYPMYFTPPLTLRSEFCNGVWLQKSRMMSLQKRGKRLTIRITISTQYQH